MKSGPETLSREEVLLKRLELAAQKYPSNNQFLPEFEDPFRYVGSWLNNKDHVSFSRGCQQIHQWTRQETQQRASSRLLELVVQGNQEAVMRILQSNPALLLCAKGRAVDYTGKTIQGLTAFQASLCAGDTEMCAMIKRICEPFENRLEILREQYHALFPQGIEACRREQVKHIFDFSNIRAAILNASHVEVEAALNKQYDHKIPLHRALDCFRKSFDDHSHKEQVFNPWHLHMAFQVCFEFSNDAESWYKSDIAWRQVVGYTQRHMPACYAQGFAQGIYYIVDKKEALRRSFDFQFGAGSILPLGQPNGLGFDFAADEWGEGVFLVRGGRRANHYSKWISINEDKLEEFFVFRCREARADTWCVVC